MLGHKQIQLTEEDLNALHEEWSDIGSLSEQCKTELYENLERRLSHDEISHLQFGLTYSDGERQTHGKVLVDDSHRFAKFAKAIEIMKQSAKEMSKWKLRDNCQRLDKNILKTTSTVKKILEENDFPPPETPKFPGLEKDLNEITKEFLELIHSEEDTTDYPSKELLYIVRNIVIIREMKEMVSEFKRDIGSMIK